MSRDPRKEQRLKDFVERAWRWRQYTAVKRVKAMLDDPTPWKDRTVADVAALKVAETIGMDMRAEKQTSGAKVFGVVMVAQRIDNATDWEAYAKQVQAEPERPAIEALAVDKKVTE